MVVEPMFKQEDLKIVRRQNEQALIHPSRLIIQQGQETHIRQTAVQQVQDIIIVLLRQVFVATAHQEAHHHQNGEEVEDRIVLTKGAEG